MLTFRSVEGGWYKQYEESLKEEGYRSWTSLDDLFNHLEANADESYRESLSKMRKMFG
jgi:hypothetical protein